MPPLREELQVSRGAPLLSGAPSWLIFDPVRHKYIRIGQDAFEMLANWSAGTVGALKARMAERFGARPDNERLVQFLGLLHRSNLTVGPAGDPVQAFSEFAQRRRQGFVPSLVHKYLFFRIPLVRPSRMLAATMWMAEPFFSRAWWVIVALFGMLGLYLSSRQFDSFISTFLHFISFEGALLYGLSLIGVKTLHELGHAYAATRYGCRVPTMGVAFLVLWPVLYTDTTDAWRLRDRRARLIIDAAGVMVELMLAAIALFLWAFLPDGPLRSIAFTVATISMVSSLIINLNPFLRFDGYYILSDAIGVENLQSRAFALGRWRMREWLFGLGDPMPEQIPRRLRGWLVVYAWATWVYRFFLFLGIALLVYNLFFKALGVLLFVIEIYWFIVRPIAREVSAWWSLGGRILRRPRAWITFGVFSLMIIAAAIPWQSRVRVQGVLEAAVSAPVYGPEPGQIVHLALSEGAQVSAGDVLVELSDPGLEHEIAQSERRIRLLDERVRRGSTNDVWRAEARIASAELAAERENLAALIEHRQALTVVATADGALRDVDPALTTGLWLPRRSVLARVVDDGKQRVRAYIDGEALNRLDRDAAGVFIPDDPLQKERPVRVAFVAAVSAAVIEIPYVASTHGGDVAVDPDGEELVARDARYQLVATTEDAAAPGYVSRGVLHLSAEPESFVAFVYRRAVQLFLREMGV